MTLLLLLACSGDPDTGEGEDTAPPDTASSLDVDVLVIGAGPAGLSAAWAADQAGASVVVLERDGVAGGSGRYAAGLYAADTSWQAELGVEDSPELALEQWSAETGAEPDAWVERLVHESGAVLAWLVGLGAEVTALRSDPHLDGAARVHEVVDPYLDRPPVHVLVPEVEDLVWLQSEALELLVEDGAVVGARYEDLRTGEQASIRAASTVVATGGFARDTELLVQDRPELDGVRVLFEAAPSTDGGGRHLLDGVVAGSQNQGAYGLYVHSLEHPELPYETLLAVELPFQLVVDLDGQRVGPESDSFGFLWADHLLEAPEQRLLAVLGARYLETAAFYVPGYLWSDPDVPEVVGAQELVELGSLLRHDTVAEAAEAWGIEPDALTATIDTYDADMAAGKDRLGKVDPYLEPIGDDGVLTFELGLGAAKAFGGAWLDEEARVLDVDGEPIPGLYAAGEVAGMLGTPAVGTGFSGSVTACYLTGLVAGEHAAGRAVDAIGRVPLAR